MYKIAKENLASLFALINETKELYLPVEVAGQTNFAAYTADAKFDLDTLKTVKSPKDVFFPQSENLYTCNKEDNKLKITPEKLVDAPFVVFGMKACDIKGIEVLDRVFLSDPVDSFYAARRANGIIVGLACHEPEESCFCKVFGVDCTEPAADVATWMIEGELYWKALTEKGEALAAELSALGAEAMFCKADVLDREALIAAQEAIIGKWGRIDVLINAAGGNMPGATIMPDKNIFDLGIDAYRTVLDLNLVGTVIPTLVFGEVMAKNGKGSIINISSMSSQQMITRVCGYSSAKAAIDNFTKWCAMEMAKKFGEGLRVNAIAPGFFATKQNAALLFNPDGTPTARTGKILAATPMGRFGKTEELEGGLLFLVNEEAAGFITGVVLPIDGGFSAYSGV